MRCREKARRCFPLTQKSASSRRVRWNQTLSPTTGRRNVRSPFDHSAADVAAAELEHHAAGVAGCGYLEQLLERARAAPANGTAHPESDADVTVGDAIDILHHIDRALVGALWRVEAATAADDLVLLQLRIAGTSSGPYRSAPPTGHDVSLSVTVALRVENSCIGASWCAANDRALRASASDAL